MNLLEHLDGPDVEELVRLGDERVLNAGEELIREGTDPSAIYVVLSGLVSTAPGEMPGIPLTMGDVIGEFSFLDGQPASSSVTAIVMRLI